RGCNPAYSKSIHTWLRFGEIMRGSLSTPYRFIPLKNAIPLIKQQYYCFKKNVISKFTYM
ncbi:hypothetical protein OFC46_24010, partial [Escherichia coli]|nr:hypothetical protein [Escherichia coli]